MKRLALLICAALSLAVLADTEIVSITDGEAAWNHRGGKVAQIHVLVRRRHGHACRQVRRARRPHLLRRDGQGAREGDPHEVTA